MNTANEQRKESPKIYVADLAAYNAGTLHGCWINANQSAEDIHEEIQALLSEGDAARAREFLEERYLGSDNRQKVDDGAAPVTPAG